MEAARVEKENTVAALVLAWAGLRYANAGLTRLLPERGADSRFQGELWEADILLPLRLWGFGGRFIRSPGHVSCHVLSTAAKSQAPPEIADTSPDWKVFCNPLVDVAHQQNYYGEFLQTLGADAACVIHHASSHNVKIERR